MSLMDRLKIATAVLRSDEATLAVPRTFNLSRGPLDQFRWPDESQLGDWEKLHVRKLRAEIEERYTRYHSFSICRVRDYMESMRIPLTPETRRSYNCLSKLHCVDFDLVPPGIFERIPHWFNHVISCGHIEHPLITGTEIIEV